MKAVTVALDAMGGDNAPHETVAGAAAATLDPHETRVILVGDTPRLQAELAKHAHNSARILFEHAPRFIPMDAKPREALDAVPDASVAVAARLVREGKAQALVSAGNTGGVILACSRHWARLEGVRRCALAAVVPTERRRGEKQDPFSLMLDVGATLDASAQDLLAFAVMGAAYAARISRNPAPLVALLSNGGEPTKGRAEIVSAHQMLKMHPALKFIGNVEGVDLPRGTADVVVTDGFTGNVVLKMLEGVSETVMEVARYAYRKNVFWRLGLLLLGSGIKQLRQLTDWQEYGGAPILGFDGVCIKAHGRSGQRAIANAIRVAAKAVSTDLVASMKEGLAKARDLDIAQNVPAGEA
ncbi:MAG: phosphate acyltransferase PlsX [Deltaproteobacteria bacterium]|nr:phosphate acyltransferase PlsX [Deltaproteobacteria bacterium]